MSTDTTIMALATNLPARADAATTGAGRTNVRHAMDALTAVTAWVNTVASPMSEHDSVGTVMGDVLTDLLHLAVAADLDFDGILAGARQRHIEECDDELIAAV